MSEPTAAWSSPSEEPPSQATVLDRTRPAGPRPALVPLRPLAAGELLDGSVALVKGFPRVLLAAGAVLAVVAAIIDLLLTLTVVGPISVDRSATLDSQQTQDLLGAAGVSGLATLFVTTVSGVLMLAAAAQVLAHVVLGEQTSLQQTLSELRPVAGRLLGLALAVAAGVFGPLVLVLLALLGTGSAGLAGLVLLLGGAGGVWLYVQWCLAGAVLVLERQTVRASLGRSRTLVRGSFWRVLGVLLLALAISYAVSTVIAIPFSLFGYNPLSNLSGTYEFTRTDAVLSAVASALAGSLVVPFSGGVRALVYLDRRMRAEALDLDLRLQGR